ncbi:MAG: ribonuclease [Oscillospiraceae bacterium]|nr:ribonuclease [Oscillospiraceae bacterium]
MGDQLESAPDEHAASFQAADQEAEISEDGEYTTPEDVALYLHTYGHLPGNFITKNEARDLGWDSSKGNLWDVAPGKSIGGDRFGNYEGLLPDGKYKECDVNYDGGYRDAERLIYGEDGSVYYTNDHYKSFTQLY